MQVLDHRVNDICTITVLLEYFCEEKMWVAAFGELPCFGFEDRIEAALVDVFLHTSRVRSPYITGVRANNLEDLCNLTGEVWGSPRGSAIRVRFWFAVQSEKLTRKSVEKEDGVVDWSFADKGSLRIRNSEVLSGTHAVDTLTRGRIGDRFTGICDETSVRSSREYERASVLLAVNVLDP